MSNQTLDFVTLRGRVISGRGTASQVKVGESPISDFFGKLQASGSLNVALEKPARFDPEKVAFPGGRRAYYWAAEINGSRCLLTRAKGHPLHIVEVLSPYQLREKFQLKDGDSVEIKVVSNLMADLSWGIEAIWSIFWKFRGSWYASRVYRAFIGPFWLIRRLATQSPQYQAKLWKPRMDVSVCHINLARDLKLRGGERQTEILVRALTAAGISRQRVVVLRGGPLAHRLQGGPELEVCLVRNRLSAVFACRSASLLHAHEAHAAQVAYAASLFGKRYLITRRLTKPVRSSSFSSAVYRKAQTVIALTEAVENSVQGRFPGISTIRIPDAWNPERPDPEKIKEIKEGFSGAFLVGYAAAMDSHEKGHTVLLQAAKELQHGVPDIRFILLGGGRLESEFRQQAEGLANVHFSGWVEDPITWIAALDLFAFPSLAESFGSTLLDALRMGVPVVASRVGGIPEVISEECGVFVPPGDAEALARQIARMYRSEELRKCLSMRGQETVSAYSPELIAQKHLDLYQNLGC